MRSDFRLTKRGTGKPVAAPGGSGSARKGPGAASMSSASARYGQFRDVIDRNSASSSRKFECVRIFRTQPAAQRAGPAAGFVLARPSDREEPADGPAAE